MNGNRRRILGSLAGFAAGLAGCTGDSKPESQGDTAADERDSEALPDEESATETDDETGNQPPSDVGSWATESYDVRRSGHAPDVRGPKSDVTKQWETERDEMTTAPVVVNGRVFVTDGPNVTALSAGGSELWSVETDGDIVSPPTVADGTVVVASNDGTTYALSAASGSERWRNDEVGIWGRAVPLVADGTVFVGGTDESPSIHALALDDGTVQWRSETEYGPIEPRTALADGTLVVTNAGGLVALDRDTGEELWRWGENNYYDIRSTPAIRDGTVYLCNQGGIVFAVDLATGEREWKRILETMNTNDLAVAVSDDTLFVPGDEYLVALDPASGEERWRLDGTGTGVAPVVADGTLYVQAAGRWTESGYVDPFLAAYSAADGEPLWEVVVDDRRPGRMTPAVADGTVFAGSVQGTVFAFSEE